MNDIKIQFDNQMKKGYFPIYGFNGIVANATQRVGFICPENIKKNNCGSYMTIHSNNNVTYSVGFVYGVTLSLTEYLQVNRMNLLRKYNNHNLYDRELSDELYSKITSVDMLFDKCIKADLCFDKHPQIHFVDESEYNTTLDYSILHPEHWTVAHIDKCDDCPYMFTEEYDQYDYYTEEDNGCRKKNINGNPKLVYLPAPIIPIQTASI